jgi:hypothetical protein
VTPSTVVMTTNMTHLVVDLSATSLARLLRDQSRSADAIACLQPIYDRFTEGFDTADLIAAKQLLGELGDAGD